jgi:hypothetical protein
MQPEGIPAIAVEVVAVTLSATALINGEKISVHRTVKPDTWYALSESGRVLMKEEMHGFLSDEIVRRIDPVVTVEIPSEDIYRVVTATIHDPR